MRRTICMLIPSNRNLECPISKVHCIQAFELDPLHESNAGEVAHDKKFNLKGAYRQGDYQ